MSSGVLRCADGEVQVATDGAPLCSGVWTLVPVPESFQLDQIDPTQASVYFGLGFSLVIPVWFAGMCVRKILSILN